MLVFLSQKCNIVEIIDYEDIFYLLANFVGGEWPILARHVYDAIFPFVLGSNTPRVNSILRLWTYSAVYLELIANEFRRHDLGDGI